MRVLNVSRAPAPARAAPTRSAPRVPAPPTRALSGASAGPSADMVAAIATAWHRVVASRPTATPFALLAALPPLSPLDALSASFTSITAALASNAVFMAGFYAWISAQVLKVFTARYKRGTWDLRALADSGGMPSSHTALSVAVTAAAGRTLGLASPLFAVSLAYALVVAYDAAGVRLHAGKQAEVLNVLLADVAREHPAAGRKLKEVLGHTPRQVAAGAALGLIVGCGMPL